MIQTGKAFIHDQFMLQNDTAAKLYHDYAKELPIIDYHCHVSPIEIAENRQYRNISEIWLHGDHYKWRAMRACGVDESFITGEASDKEKFLKWAETVPYTLGNPLYHWTHLELKRYFDIDELVNAESAEGIWEQTKEQLQSSTLSTRGIIKQSNVEIICTTDDPTDGLEAHQSIAQDRFETAVYPAFRPDKALMVGKSYFTDYISSLETTGGIKIDSLQKLLDVLEARAHFFHQQGCRLADHGIETIPFQQTNDRDGEAIFRKALAGEPISQKETEQYQTYVLLFLGKLYHSLGWTMQFHLGALRNTNSRMFKQLGADTGFDSIGDFSFAKSLTLFLNELDKTNELPQSILYTLNPNHNEVIASAIGSFQGDTPGKIQFGSGWWFNDTKQGMEKQLNDLANIGLLSQFVGMLTDSRSFLSYTRHEYFRRIMCNLIGSWVEAGEWPADEKWIGQLVQGICYRNAKRYFAF